MRAEAGLGDPTVPLSWDREREGLTMIVERVHALITRFGSNALGVQVWPRGRIADVERDLVASGIPASPTSVDDTGIAGGLLVFYPDDFGPEVAVQCVSTLLLHGTSAYAYELLHEHGAIDIDLFQRVGRVCESTEDAPVFLQIWRDEEHDTGEAVLLGDARALRRAVSAIGVVEHCDLAEGPSGLDSVQITLDSEVNARAQALVDLLDTNGMNVHVQAFHRRSTAPE